MVSESVKYVNMLDIEKITTENKMPSKHYEKYIKPLREAYRKAKWTSCSVMMPSAKLGKEAVEMRAKLSAYADKLIQESSFDKPTK